MQITSQTWRDLLASGAPLQARATIGGVAYTDISAPVITRALMQDRLGVGNVVSASLALAVRGAAGIPRSAAVVIEVRLNDGQAASEWLPQGTFYISRRMRDPVTGLLALECYDALLKANAVWTPSAGAWPRTMAAVTAELAALLGVTLDSRTVIPTGAAYAMSEPAEGTTIRDALGVVAQAAGGNWVMTPGNLLRLVRVGESGGTVDVTGVTGGIDVGQAGAVTGVRSTVDGVVTLIGDDTGIVVDVDIAPMIAAEMAEDLIGQAYAPFRLTGAIYDPAAELGDGVRAGAGGEVVSALCSEQATYGPAFRGDIAAPDPGEVTDEYPYIVSADRTLALAKAAAIEAVDRLDDELTQREIFNRLTDNGAAQGLLLYDGQLYINANYINAGYLNVGRINFNEPDRYYDVPDENDPDSLLGGQTVVDGWIVNASGTGEITVFSCGFAIPLRGKTVTVTFAYKGFSLAGGTDSWSSISDTAEQRGHQTGWYAPSGRIPPNPYTRTVTVPDDAMTFRMSMDCTGVKQIEVSLDTPVTPSDSIEYNYEGQRIGEHDPFNVYRDGTLITYAKSIFRGAARFSGIYLDSPLDVDGGGTGATTAAAARTNLEITPANIGAVSTSAVIDVAHGGTGATTAAVARTNLKITPANIGAVAKSGDTMTGALKLLRDGDAQVEAQNTETSASVYLLSSDAYHGIYSNGYWSGSSFIPAGKWMLYRDANGKIIFNDTLGVDHGGTGATTAAAARTNLGAVAKSGDTINGNLIINGNLSVNADGYIGLTSDYGVTIGDTDAKIVKLTDGTVYMQSSGDASVYVTNGGNAEIRSDSGAASIILTPNGDVNVSGDVALDAPLPVTSGGTGATTAAVARTNLKITPANIGAVPLSGTGGSPMTGNLDITRESSNANIRIKTNVTGVTLWMYNPINGVHGIYSDGYYDGSAFNSSGKYMISRGNDGKVTVADHYNITQTDTAITQAIAQYCPTKTGSGASGTWGINISGNAANITGTVGIDHGGTGATSAEGIRNTLGIIGFQGSVTLQHNVAYFVAVQVFTTYKVGLVGTLLGGFDMYVIGGGADITCSRSGDKYTFSSNAGTCIGIAIRLGGV